MVDSPDLARQLESIHRSLRLIEAERVITRRLSLYGQFLDYGREEDWLDCFTEDGVFEVRFAGDVDGTRFPRRGGAESPTGQIFSGRVALRTFVEHHTREPEAFHRHVAHNPLIEVADDFATSLSYITRQDVDTDGIIYTRAFGRYHDRLRRCADGEWRFEARLAEVEAMDFRPFRSASNARS